MIRQTQIRTQLDELLAEHDADSAWFATVPGFAWLTGGGSNFVSLAGDTGVAAVGYDGDDITVVADHIELERIQDEEVLVETTYHEFDWYEDRLDSVVAGLVDGTAIADFDLEGAIRISAPVGPFPLTDRELERYEQLSHDTAQVVESVARDITPVMTERAAAANLTHDLTRKRIDPLVVLVGGEERGARYRHFTPSDSTLGNYAKLTVLGRRGGLHTALTRTVAFESTESALERYHDAQRVAATALRATQRVGRAGGTSGDVFDAIVDAYAAVGYPDEWRAHHQGGMTGYSGREWFARPDGTDPVILDKPYAWNPSIGAAKVEETALVTAADVDVLTTTGEWPTTSVEPVGEGRPVELHDVFSR